MRGYLLEIALVTGARLASYWLFAALGAACAGLKLGPAVLAGLFAYTVLDAAHKKLSQIFSPRSARRLSLFLLVLVTLAVSWVVADLLRQSLATIPELLSAALPVLSRLSENYGMSLPFGTLEELREVLLAAVKDNVRAITRTGGTMTKGFFQILVGVIIAVLCFIGEPPALRRQSLAFALFQELSHRTRRFLAGFEKILGAQVTISGVNTALTAVFLLAMGFPFAAFLIPATFILGLLPLIGNVLSNAIITASGLSLSLRHALFGLGFLILIHKLEYFLNSRIVGSSIHSAMWQVLLAILIGEAILGVPGIMIAPAVFHYVREELRDIPPQEPLTSGVRGA